MKPRDFQDLIDRYGVDLAVWPAQARQAGERHLAESPGAQATLLQARQLVNLIGSLETPPAPLVEAIIERATAQSQMKPAQARRPSTNQASTDQASTDQGWFGRSRWYAFAFASCLVLGVALGFVSAQSQDLPNSVYNLIDGSGIGESYD